MTVGIDMIWGGGGGERKHTSWRGLSDKSSASRRRIPDLPQTEQCASEGPGGERLGFHWHWSAAEVEATEVEVAVESAEGPWWARPQSRYKHICNLKPFKSFFIVVVQYSLMALTWPLSVLQNPEEISNLKRRSRRRRRRRRRGGKEKTTKQRREVINCPWVGGEEGEFDGGNRVRCRLWNFLLLSRVPS